MLLTPGRNYSFKKQSMKQVSGGRALFSLFEVSAHTGVYLNKDWERNVSNPEIWGDFSHFMLNGMPYFL